MRSSGIGDGMQVGWFSLQPGVRKMIRSCRMQWGTHHAPNKLSVWELSTGKAEVCRNTQAQKLAKMVFDRTTIMFRPGRYQIKREISNTDRQIRTDFQIVRS